MAQAAPEGRAGTIRIGGNGTGTATHAQNGAGTGEICHRMQIGSFCILGVITTLEFIEHHLT
jgi:hypothetical protein